MLHEIEWCYSGYLYLISWSAQSLVQWKIHQQQKSPTLTDIACKLLKSNPFQLELSIFYEHLNPFNYCEMAS